MASQNKAIPDWPALMGEKMAAAYLGRSESWLRDARARKVTPPRVRAAGSPMYRRRDLDLWIATLPNEEELAIGEEQSAANEAFGCT